MKTLKKPQYQPPSSGDVINTKNSTDKIFRTKKQIHHSTINHHFKPINQSNSQNPSSSNINHSNKSYVQTAKNIPHVNQSSTNAETDISQKLVSFLDDLKSHINPLISLLTTFINKLILKND